MGWLSNPWVVSIGSSLIVSIGIALFVRAQRRKQDNRTHAVASASTGGTAIAAAAPIESLHVGDVTNITTTAAPQADERGPRIRYASKRFLDRVVAVSKGVSYAIEASILDEVEAAVGDFSQNATDLHLLKDEVYRDRLSAFGVRIRHELATVRRLEQDYRDLWKKAHEEHESGRFPIEVWLTQRKNLHSEESNRIRMAAHRLIEGWGEQARSLLADLANQ